MGAFLRVEVTLLARTRKGYSMAEPTSKFQPETLDYIARNARKVDEVARKLGISPEAIIGAVANEYDTRYNPELSFDRRGGTGQALGDFFSRYSIWDGFNDHQDIKDNYEFINRRDQDKKFTDIFMDFPGRFANPAMVDVGPGNIRIATAIDLLNQYAARYPDENNDPLGIKKYMGNYDKLRDDLLDFKNPDTTLAFAGLMTKSADAFFLAQDKAAWGRLSPDERDALRIMYYKIGPDKLSDNIGKKQTEAKKVNRDYNFNPYGDGGEQHLNNLEGVRNALHLGRIQGDGVMPYVPEDELVTDSRGGGLTGINAQYTYDAHAAALKRQKSLEDYAGFDTPRERLGALGLNRETKPRDAAALGLGSGTTAPLASVSSPVSSGRERPKGDNPDQPGRTPSSNAERFWDGFVRGRASLKDILARWTE